MGSLPCWLDWRKVCSYNMGFRMCTLEIISFNELSLRKAQENLAAYSPKSITQIPVPVPTSRTRAGRLMGALYNLPLFAKVKMWWCWNLGVNGTVCSGISSWLTKSSRFCSASSFGCHKFSSCLTKYEVAIYQQICAVFVSVITTSVLTQQVSIGF